MTETEINDLFAFKFDELCDTIDVEYDEENDKVVRYNTIYIY